MKSLSLLVLAFASLQSIFAIDPISINPPTATASSTPTSTSPSPSGSPALFFGPVSPSEVDTCSSSVVITWVWDPNGAPLAKGITLSVTNINVTQEPPITTADITARQIIPSVTSGSVIETGTVSAAPGSSTPLLGFIEVLTTGVDPSIQDSVTWPQANLPQGSYVFLATATDAGNVSEGVGGIWSSWIATSSPFFIRNGSDTSCLPVIATSPTSSEPTSSGTTAPIDTAAGSSPSSIGSISASKPANRGAIAGGVIGGLAAFVALLGVFLCYRHGRRNSTVRDTDGSPGPSIGKWGALGSFDSTNGGRSAARSRSKNGDQLDPITSSNTAANSRSQKSGGFGLAALGLAKSQDNAPSAFTAKSKHSKRNRRDRFNPTGTSDSTAGMLSSFSSDGHIDPYANLGRMNGREPTEEIGFSQSVPLRDLSPTSPPIHEESSWYPSFPNSAESLDSAAPVLPITYEMSPFMTPPPSEPASRHNSRSYSRTSAPNASSPTQSFAALGVSDSASTTDFQPNRARSQSQNNSPTSTHPAHSIDSPGAFLSHHKRASSPDAIVYTLEGRNLDQSQAATSGSKGAQKRTPRKPVPSYTPDEAQDMFPDQVLSPVSPVYAYSATAPSRPAAAKPKPSRRAAPAAPYESASSSTSSVQAMYMHGLEHKDSAHSLASLRTMEGDMSGYGAVLGKEGGKQMHVLIPDMPLEQ